MHVFIEVLELLLTNPLTWFKSFDKTKKVDILQDDLEIKVLYHHGSELEMTYKIHVFLKI